MDHNQLDVQLREHGWYYDNGWLHDSIHWDCYTDSNYGSSKHFVILARDGNGRILKMEEKVKTEVWSGPLVTEQDIDNLIAFFSSQNHGQ